MGIGAVPQQLLRDLAKKLPAGFSVCELGDQEYAVKPKRDKPKSWERAPAEAFYRSLGCGTYITLDANGKATWIADLNKPLFDHFWQDEETPDYGFDLVTNWGTTEHVFDQAQCWRTIHDLTKVGGYIAGEQPFIGYKDHGFYSIHPTLIKDVAAVNGYEIEHLSTPEMERGTLVRYILQRTAPWEFRVPQQGKYQKHLKV